MNKLMDQRAKRYGGGAKAAEKMGRGMGEHDTNAGAKRPSRSSDMKDPAFRKGYDSTFGKAVKHLGKGK